MNTVLQRGLLPSLAMVIALMLCFSASPVALAAQQDPCYGTDPTLALGCIPAGESPPPTPAPAPTTSTPAPSASPTASPKASTNAEEWAQGAAESSGKIAGTLKESYQNPNKVPVSSNTIVAYAFTWAIGMVILAVALMVSVARAVRTTTLPRTRLRTHFA